MLFGDAATELVIIVVESFNKFLPSFVEGNVVVDSPFVVLVGYPSHNEDALDFGFSVHKLKVGIPRRGPPQFPLDREDGILQGSECLVTVSKTPLLGVHGEIPKVPVDVIRPVEVPKTPHPTAAIDDPTADCGLLHPVKDLPEVIALVLLTTGDVHLFGNLSQSFRFGPWETDCGGHVGELVGVLFGQLVLHHATGGENNFRKHLASGVSTLKELGLECVPITKVTDGDRLEGAANHESVGANETEEPGNELECGRAVIRIGQGDGGDESTDLSQVSMHHHRLVTSIWGTGNLPNPCGLGRHEFPSIGQEHIDGISGGERNETLRGGVVVPALGKEGGGQGDG